jgi:hypothetical protein
MVKPDAAVALDEQGSQNRFFFGRFFSLVQKR